MSDEPPRHPPVPASIGEVSLEKLIEADSELGAVGKLVSMVILLAIKDEATEVWFRPRQDEIELSYVVEGFTYQLVPPPAHIGPRIGEVLRSLAAPSRRRRRLGARLRRWAGSLDRLSTGVSWFRFEAVVGTWLTPIDVVLWPNEFGETVKLTLHDATNSRASREAHASLGRLLDARRPKDPAKPPTPEPEPEPARPIPSLDPIASETLEGARSDLWKERRSCVEVLEACLARIEEWESRVGAWVVVDREGAMTQARALDEERKAGGFRALHGVPIAVKDIIDVAGWPTGCGASRWANGPASADATIVARLREAGAVIVGKTVTTPYAWIDPPPTRNPWNLDRTPGGSSSGSAAAVACGMVLGAIGTQTGGSITRPAAFCGVCGLKPTRGRLPLDGILPFAPSLDHPGPIARTIADLALLWKVLAGHDARDLGKDHNDDPPIRLGRLRGVFEERAEPAMTAALDAALAALATAGVAQVEDVPLPAGFEAAHAHHRVIMAAEAAAFHSRRLEADPDDYPPRIRALIEEGRGVPATAYLEARAAQAALSRAFDESDWPTWLYALVTPAAPGAAPGLDTTGDPVMNSPWSLTGLPTVTLPIGLDPQGLPLGLQLIGRRHGERPLLQIARRCEQALALARTSSS